MKNSITKLIASSFVIGALVVPAYADAISDRQDKMKTIGKSMGIVGKMAKGETDFDSAASLAAFVAMKDAAAGFGDLFPDRSDSGDTEASPAIFTDRSGFAETQAAFEADLATATQAAPADLAALRTTLGMVGENCGTCHKAYRVKKN